MKGNYIKDNHQLLSIWKEATRRRNKRPQIDCGLLESRGFILYFLGPPGVARPVCFDHKVILNMHYIADTCI